MPFKVHLPQLIGGFLFESLPTAMLGRGGGINFI
jgi:hypothetical protein